MTGDLAADLRYALRSMRNNLGFTAIAASALALGIGANTAVFTVVNAVLLNPLPYPQPDRIMALARRYPGQDNAGFANSIPKFMAWRQNTAFESMALYNQGPTGMNFGSSDTPVSIKALRVSADYFRVFGFEPAAGRTFTPTEDLPGGPQLVVVSHAMWQTKLASDPNIVGHAILLNGSPYTLLGILPASFQPNPEADIWIPLQADPNSDNQGHYLAAAGRLRPGVSLAAAQAQLSAAGERFRASYPKFMDKNEGVAVIPMRDAVVGPVRTALLVLSGAVLLVLLIACANVANLLLARASARQHELAIRAAIGASRGRVIRQLLTESVLLAAFGGILGFAIGAFGVRALLSLVPGNLPRITNNDGANTALALFDWRITIFALGVTLITAILFGILPALQASRGDLGAHLKESAGRTGTAFRQRARSVLVVTEISLAMILLIGAVLLIRSFAGLQNVKSGIDAHHVLTLQSALTSGSYATTASVDRLSTEGVRRIEALPGVEAAASMIVLPIESGVDLPFTIAGRTPAQGDYEGDSQWRSISPHYFDVFRIPLLRGRVISETDAANSLPVIVINEKMAQKYWPKQDPIGQVMVVGKGLGPQFADPPRQVIGIVGTVRENGLSRGETEVMYIPGSQVPEGMTKLANTVLPMSWAVRTKTEPLSLQNTIEKELRTIDAQIPISHERTMEQVMEQSVARQTFNALLLSIFAGVALVLAAIGIYGLMSYSVEQRTQEIGIRIALGALPGSVLGNVLTQGMRLAVIGVAVGLGLAYGFTRVLGTLLFGVKASDPLTFTLVPLMLLLVALIAALIPARRATAIDPAIALRYE